jgi:hypothetical protein
MRKRYVTNRSEEPVLNGGTFVTLHTGSFYHITICETDFFVSYSINFSFLYYLRYLRKTVSSFLTRDSNPHSLQTTR